MATKNGLFKLQKCLEHFDKDISVDKKVTDIKLLTILRFICLECFPFHLPTRVVGFLSNVIDVIRLAMS